MLFGPFIVILDNFIAILFDSFVAIWIGPVIAKLFYPFKVIILPCLATIFVDYMHNL